MALSFKVECCLSNIIAGTPALRTMHKVVGELLAQPTEKSMQYCKNYSKYLKCLWIKVRIQALTDFGLPVHVWTQCFGDRD